MSHGHHVFFLPCLEPGATRTLEMTLLGWDLGQRSLVLVPAEHEAKTVTQTWWAGGDIHLHGHHREPGRAHSHSQPSQQTLVGQGSVWPSGGRWQHGGGREHFHSTPGSSDEALLGLSAPWVSCQRGSSIKQGCGASCWIGQKTFRARSGCSGRDL